MKNLLVYFSLLVTLLLFAGCDYKEREKALAQKMEELNQKEQQLLLREKNLQLEEDSIKLLIARMDSVSYADSIKVLPPALTGQWTSKMICTETNCSGSAVGDTQTDTWEIATQDTAVVIRSISKGNINRIYTGNYFNSNKIRVSLLTENIEQEKTTKRTIELNDIKPNKMRGTRVVTQADGCQITYSVELDKKS